MNALLRLSDRTIGCFLDDISAGGAFIRTGLILEPGTELGIQLSRQGLKKPLLLGATVVRSLDAETATAQRMPAGLSVRFEPMPAEDAERLMTLLRDLGLTVPGDAKPPVLSPDLPLITPLPIAIAPAPPMPPPIITPPPMPAAITPAPDRLPAPSSAEQRLMMQLSGVLAELGETQTRLRRAEEELTRLREALARTKGG